MAKGAVMMRCAVLTPPLLIVELYCAHVSEYAPPDRSWEWRLPHPPAATSGEMGDVAAAEVEAAVSYKLNRMHWPDTEVGGGGHSR